MRTSGLMQALHTLTATDIVQATRSGHTTCEAVARACLNHIAEREPAVQAWQYLNGDHLNVARKSQSILKGMNKQCLIKRSYVENRK